MTLKRSLLLILCLTVFGIHSPSWALAEGFDGKGTPETAGYWADKAGLAATYGNDAAAVEYYQKALVLDPNRSDFHYFMGISYSEMKLFGMAIEAINRALSLNPDDPRYFYGRGRVQLMMGNVDDGMADLEKAAQGGDRDARNHLAFIASGKTQP